MIALKDENIKKEIENKDIFIENIKNVIKDEKAHDMFCDIEEFLPLCDSKLSKDLPFL